MSHNIFIPLTKVDEEKRLVYGIATAESPDRSGEICDYATTKPYYEKWSAEFEKVTDGKSLGNLRSMHGKVAAGKITDIKFNDDLRQIEICAKVVDDNEWQKVLDGVYTGFSQGGAYVKRWTDDKDPALKRYTAKPQEVSLVDVPCLPVATFEYVKSDGSVEMRKFHDSSNLNLAIRQDIITAATGTALLLGKSADDWEEFAPPVCDVIKAKVRDAVEKYSDSQSRDSNGRWTSDLAIAAAGIAGSYAGSYTGKLIGSTAGRYIGGAAGSLIGGAVASPLGAIPAAVAGATAGEMIGGQVGSLAGTLVGGFAGSAIATELTATEDDKKERKKNQEKMKAAKVMDETCDSIVLYKALWDESSEDLVDLVKFVDTVAKMACQIDPDLPEEDSVLIVVEEIAKGSSDQPRDEKGRWSVTNAALNAIRGAVAGAKSGLMSAGPSAAFSLLARNPKAAIATAIANTVAGAASGAVAGALSSSDNVESNAETTANAVNGARGALSAIQQAHRIVTNPAARTAAVNSAKTVLSRVPAAVRTARSSLSAVGRANSALTEHAHNAASAIVGAAASIVSHGKLYEVASHIGELQKMGVDISEIVSAIENEENGMNIKNEDVVAKATELAKSAGDEAKWPTFIVEARTTLEKALETPPATAPAATPEALEQPVEKLAEAEAEQKPTEAQATAATDEVQQVWLAKDGSPHVKKADALAKNRDLEVQALTKTALSPLEAALSKALPGDAVEKTKKFGDLKKYFGSEVWDASRAIDALSSIVNLILSEMYEDEKDPGQLASLKSAMDSLKAFIIAELQEDDGSVDSAIAGGDDTLAMADKLGELAKSGGKAKAAQAIHDHAKSLGASCDAEKAALTDGLEKAASERDALQKAINDFIPKVEELGTLVKSQAEKIAELEKRTASPAPRPVLRSVSKGADSEIIQGSDPKSEDLVASFAKLSDSDKATLLVKLSQSQPMNVIGR